MAAAARLAALFVLLLVQAAQAHHGADPAEELPLGLMALVVLAVGVGWLLVQTWRRVRAGTREAALRRGTRPAPPAPPPGR